MKAWLVRQGCQVSRKRVQRLMRIMGLRAIYRRPRTSRAAPDHRVYPYLLENVKVAEPNQVWAADITYLPMARGFLYLVAIMDWHSRYVVAWRLSRRRTFASRRCRRPGAGPGYSTPTKAASSPAGSSPKC